MRYEGYQCYVEEWKTDGADIKVSTSVADVTTEFQTILIKQLEKKGLSIVKTKDEAQIVVRGGFIRIDEGNRILRYFFARIAGKVVVEVKGELIINGEETIEILATGQKTWGTFGGASKRLLVLSAKACAQTASKCILTALKKA